MPAWLYVVVKSPITKAIVVAVLGALLEQAGPRRRP